MVEKVFDGLPDGSVHRGHGSCLPAAHLESLPISYCLRLVDRNARLHVFLPLQELLQSSLQKGSLVFMNFRVSLTGLSFLLEEGTRRETSCRQVDRGTKQQQ